MNRKEQKLLAEFPQEMDAIIKKEFGEDTECETSYDFFGTQTHVTNFKAKGAKKKQIDLFIKGFMAGHMNLRERIENFNT